MLEFYQSSLEWLSPVDKNQVVVVSDAYYIDDQSRTWLRESGFKYLVAVNQQRFQEIWKPLSLKVSKPGDWTIAWNSKTKEAALLYWHEKYGKQYILTNAFSYIRGDTDINYLPLQLAYKYFFNTADRLNAYLHHREYPYRRVGWMYSFDDFHFSTLIWNTYILFHEFYSIEDNMEWKSFCVDLARELWGQIKKDGK